MTKKSTIRSITTFFMLVVFTLSITPKNLWHDLFAGHIDTVQRLADDGHQHISKTGFNCECNTLVATSPFVEVSIFSVAADSRAFTVHHPDLYSFTYIHDAPVRALRGPPASV